MRVTSLRKKSEFQALFKGGRRIFQEHVNVICLREHAYTEMARELKIAYIVSKKISPKAVIRNRIKRRMRASIYQILKDNELKTSLLIAIRASSSKIIDAPFQQLQTEIRQAFEQCRKL